jgi:hypothetical protein
MGKGDKKSEVSYSSLRVIAAIDRHVVLDGES